MAEHRDAEIGVKYLQNENSARAEVLACLLASEIRVITPYPFPTFRNLSR